MELRHPPKQGVTDGVLDVPIGIYELGVAALEDGLESLLLLLLPKLVFKCLGFLTLVDFLFLL